MVYLIATCRENCVALSRFLFCILPLSLSFLLFTLSLWVSHVKVVVPLDWVTCSVFLFVVFLIFCTVSISPFSYPWAILGQANFVTLFYPNRIFYTITNITFIQRLSPIWIFGKQKLYILCFKLYEKEIHWNMNLISLKIIYLTLPEELNCLSKLSHTPIVKRLFVKIVRFNKKSYIYCIISSQVKPKINYLLNFIPIC